MGFQFSALFTSMDTNATPPSKGVYEQGPILLCRNPQGSMDDLKIRLQPVCLLHHQDDLIAPKLQALSFQHLSDEGVILVHGLGDPSLEALVKDAYVLSHIYLAGSIPGLKGDYELSLVGEVDHQEVAVLFEAHCRMSAYIGGFNSDNHCQRKMRQAVQESHSRSRMHFRDP